MTLKNLFQGILTLLWLLSPDRGISGENEKQQPMSGGVKKIILTTQGGSGHLQAARRIQQDLENQGVSSHTVDVIKEKYMRTAFVNVGKHGTNHWNALNRKGDMKSIHFFASIQWMAEYLYGKRYYKKILKLLTRFPEVDEVIDTQPLNSDKILKAIYTYNRIRSDRNLNYYYHKNSGCKGSASERCIGYRKNKPDVTYRKILTDLPTRKVDQFWFSLQKVRPEWVPLMTFVTPLTAGDLDGSRTEAFYRQLLPNLMGGLKNPLKYSYGPLRQGFLDRIRVPVKDSESISVSLSHQKDFSQLITAGNLNKFSPVLQGQTMTLLPSEGTELHSMMLGSQIQAQFLLQYLQEEINYYQRRIKGRYPLMVFVFTGHNSGPDSLFSRVLRLITEKSAAGEIPAGLHIVPLGNQDDQMISNLYSRARMVLIRSGGLSCMEAEAVVRGVVLIHSGYPGEQEDLSFDLVTKGMPGWEAGNALHVLDTVRYQDGSRRSFVINPALMPKILDWYDKQGLRDKRQEARLLPTMSTAILAPSVVDQKQDPDPIL